jgi:O-methyltransferase
MLQILRSLASKIPVGLYDKGRAVSLLEQNLRGQLSNSFPQNSREAVWEHLFTTIGANQKVLLLEFGVFDGRSIQKFAELNHNSASRFIGFDSFDGLPEDWSSDCPKGTFSQGGRIPSVQDSRITFVKGWFSDTVIPRMDGVRDPDAIVICHFDADLYSSTLFCLTSMLQRFEGFYFVFDEFPGHEARALYDVMLAYPLEISFMGRTRERYPHQVSGRLINRTKLR